MKIPVSKDTGFPTVSPSMLRKYGAGGFDLEEQEQPRGCPRQWKAHYIDRIRGPRNPVLEYGTIIHRAFQLMESEQLPPDEALEKAWADGDPVVVMDQTWFDEASEDVQRYMERETTPFQRYATLATELRLSSELYVDEDFGPIHMQGIVDRVSLDFDDPGLIHIGDWKTNRNPPSIEAIQRSFAAKTYVWLTYRNLRRLGIPADVVSRIDQPRVFFHLDAIKWREMDPVFYSDYDLERWHAWTVQLVKRILRDEDAEPVLNEGCPQCPVRDSCPKFLGLPALGGEVLADRPSVEWSQVSEEDRDRLAAWIKAANGMRLLLENAVKEMDARFKADAKAGPIITSTYTWAPETVFSNLVDAREVHKILGEEFYDLVKLSKAAIERAARGRPPAVAAELLETVTREATGTTVSRKDT